MSLPHLICRIAVLYLAVVTTAWGAESGSEKLVFPLEEVPNFDNWDMGHHCVCQSEPESNVVYPAFSSGQPFYGQIRVDMELDDPHSGTVCHFALDESGGTGAGYDRLYVDLNHDGRLSDEVPVRPLRELPQGHLFTQKWPSPVPPVWFDYVTFSSRDGAGTHSVQILPRFTNGGGYPRLNFQATTARRGSIEIAGRRIVARIWNSNPIGTRWDRPSMTVRLETPRGSVALPHWLGCERLRAMHKIGDKFWRLSTTPSGSQLVVEPYAAGLGTVEIGLAGRPPQSATFYGSLFARDKAVAVGEPSQSAYHRGVRKWVVPAGDYAPGSLLINCGSSLFWIAGDDPSGAMSARRGTASAYPWRIRANEVFTLEFADKPEILFASPPDGARLKPGAELKVVPVVIDPKLNTRIEGLRLQPGGLLPPASSAAFDVLPALLFAVPAVMWALVGRRRRRYRYLAWLCAVGLLAFAGTVVALDVLRRPAASGPPAADDLAPHLTITRANGEVVASGSMPFG
jgi:hypothetical protein